jgi:acetylornithine deacetylase/succinyl-diaminopimelate desuccinylase-like protein
MARAGELPVHVRVLIEGEEEVGGESVASWVRDDTGPVDVAIVFDSGMPDPQTPAITVGLRGVVQLSLGVRTASHNLHSGLYGGSVLNALHVLHGLLAQVLPGPDGRLREELRVGISPPSEAELATWRRLIPGEQVLAQAGGIPAYAGAGEQYYLRNGADASLDVNEVHGGEPRTVVPGQAGATLTMRLAPRQDPELMRATLERLLRAALPAGAQLEIGAMAAAPALFDPGEPALQLAAAALQRACGSAPAFLRSGGSIPIVAEMAKRGYPVIVGGFGLPDDRIHAANESFSLQSLASGEAAARELYLALASLRS